MERLSDADVRQIIEMTWRKTPAHAIADRLGISSRTVHRWRARSGFRCRSDGRAMQVDLAPCAKCDTSTPKDRLTPVRRVCYACAYGHSREENT